MTILWLVFWIAVIGTCVWFFRRYAPVAEWIKTAVVIVAVFVIVYLIFSNFGIFHITTGPVRRII